MITQLNFSRPIEELMESSNIADMMTDEQCSMIGAWAKQGFEEDQSSRADWEKKTADGMKLALQLAEQKSWPWPDCSNIKFPLVTVAALYFHARAYPALVPASGIVYCGPVGYNPPQEQVDRAARVGAHMSYQIQRCTGWEAETDRALLIIPIVGCAFKKVEYDAHERVRRSRLVLPQNLVVNYYTVDLKTAPRISEKFELTHNEVRELEIDEVWRTKPKDAPRPGVSPQDSGPIQAVQDRSQGLTPNDQTGALVGKFIEQHCWLDLDGDNYQEPYIVTFDADSGFLRSIRARYLPSGIMRTARGRIKRITAIEFYIKLPFIPSPDGGFYDLGFGSLLGPLNHAVDTFINQLADAGTMATLGGGFLGRGMRIKKGASTFTPMEWKTVDSVGDDISKNIYPLPVREPSKVLLELAIYLIGYAERIASANEIQAGEIPQHNVKAGAMQIADQNGARIFSAIFKRLHRAFGEEYGLFYRLNQVYPIDLDYEANGKWFQVTEKDYSGPSLKLECAADPEVITDLQAQQQALMIYQTAQATPGHKMNAVVRRLYKAYRVRDVDEILPEGEMPPPPNVQLIAAQAKAMDAETKRMTAQAEIVGIRVKLQLEAEKLTAEIFELYAKADKLRAEADAAAAGQQIAALNLEIAAMKERREGIMGFVELLKDQLFGENDDETNNGTSLGGSGAGITGASLPSMAGSPGNSAVLPLPDDETGAIEGGAS